MKSKQERQAAGKRWQSHGGCGVEPEYAAAAGSGRLEQKSWETGDQIINFEQSAVDQTVEANAEQWYSVGRKSYIVRRVPGKCCEQCANLAGRYEYPDTPQDVFLRHENC